MARYYFQNHQINDDDFYLVDADTQLIARARMPTRSPFPGEEWMTGMRLKRTRSTMWKEVPPDTYQGHMEDGSSVQKHSAGGIYPYVIFAQETTTGIAYGVLGPKKPNGVLIGAYHSAVEYAINLKGGA